MLEIFTQIYTNKVDQPRWGKFDPEIRSLIEPKTTHVPCYRVMSLNSLIRTKNVL